MNTFFSLVFVIAYFLVFILGLLRGFYIAWQYYRKYEFMSACLVLAISLFAIGGLIQAIMGA